MHDCVGVGTLYMHSVNVCGYIVYAQCERVWVHCICTVCTCAYTYYVASFPALPPSFPMQKNGESLVSFLS